ncbi:hypothetical protein BaRGS_00039572 [Batillaria attramentaria]|uniref:Uncharacterized protein n=1 Tax=Batillaria attramentaria TaxID=370345 RepID=A0ABD0J3N1_9CAEN
MSSPKKLSEVGIRFVSSSLCADLSPRMLERLSYDVAVQQSKAVYRVQVAGHHTAGHTSRRSVGHVMFRFVGIEFSAPAKEKKERKPVLKTKPVPSNSTPETSSRNCFNSVRVFEPTNLPPSCVLRCLRYSIDCLGRAVSRVWQERPCVCSSTALSCLKST